MALHKDCPCGSTEGLYICPVALHKNYIYNSVELVNLKKWFYKSFNCVSFINLKHWQVWLPTWDRAGSDTLGYIFIRLTMLLLSSPTTPAYHQDRVSLYNHCYPGTHFVDLTGLELRDLPASTSRVLILMAYTIIPGFIVGLGESCPEQSPPFASLGDLASP